MDKLKEYCHKLRSNIKFSRAGEGHRLSQAQGISDDGNSVQRPSSAARSAAGQAALARFDRASKPTAADADRSKAIIQQKAKAQLVRESTAAKEAKTADDSRALGEAKSKELSDDEGLFFECKELFPHLVLPKRELIGKIEEGLLEQLADNELIAACVLFKTCNSDGAQVEKATNLLCTYLTNMLSNADNLDKYGRIRRGNRVFQQVVEPLRHSDILMRAIGYSLVKDCGPSQEYYYVFTGNVNDIDMLLDVLHCTGPVAIELSHDMRLFRVEAGTETTKSELPESFYEVTRADVRKRHEMMRSKLEMDETLMSSQFRAQMETKSSQTHSRCIARFRFPCNIVLQGTFRPADTLADLVQFVRGNLALPDMPFTLTAFLRGDLKVIVESSHPSNSSLESQQMCPAVLFYFSSTEEVGKSEVVFSSDCRAMLAD